MLSTRLVKLRATQLFQVAHRPGIASPFDLLLIRLPIQFWMNVEATLVRVLLSFNHEWVRLGECVVTNGSHLPRNLHSGYSIRNAELMIGYFPSHVQARC